jgi:hypothetical protein
MSIFQLVDKSGNDHHTKLEDPTIRKSSRSESFLYNLQYNKNYQSASHQSAGLGNSRLDDFEEESGGNGNFETVTQLFSTKPSAFSGDERKRRKKRHARMHHEL